MDAQGAGEAAAPRRIDLATASDFELGGLTVHPATREVVNEGEIDTLEPRVMQVLVALAEERGRVVSRDHLIERCWAGRIVSEDAINTCMTKVRKLGEARGAFTIHTVPRVGYRLVSGAPGARPSLARAPGSAQWRLGTVAGALALAAIAVGVLALRLTAPAPYKVAILPFELGSTSTTAASLAKRVEDDLAGSMTARHIDVARAASHARAPILVKGSVDASGPEARIRVSLEDQRAHLILWQGQFAGPAGFDSHLPEQVSTKLTSMVTTGQGLYASSQGTVRPEALKAYIQGMDSFRERRNVIEHLAFMRSMRELAPRVPIVHAAYAQSLVEASLDQPPTVRQAWRQEAIQEAGTAVRADPKLGLGYTALSNAMAPRDFAGRLKVLERGLRNAPLDGPINAYAGLFLAQVGRPQEGVPYSRRGETIDPDAAPRTYSNASYLTSTGFVQEGRQELLRARQRWPDNNRNPVFFTLFAIQTMNPGDGLATINDMQAHFPDAVPASVWLSFFNSLKCNCDRERVAKRIAAAAKSGETPASLAFIALTRLGRLDDAFEVAQLAQLDGMLCEYRLLFSPETAPMRRDIRFMDLAAQLGLAQYWQISGQWPEYCADPTLPYNCRVEAARALAAIG